MSGPIPSEQRRRRRLIIQTDAIQYGQGYE